MTDTADRVIMRLADEIEAELIAQGGRSAPINYREAALKALSSHGLREAVEILDYAVRNIQGDREDSCRNALAALKGETASVPASAGETSKVEEQTDEQ